MSTTSVIIIVSLFVLMDGIVISALFAVLRQKFAALVARFPQQPHKAGAVTRRFQSIALDMFNLGYSVHITVDDACLHIVPTRVARFFGAVAISIPWDAIIITKRGRLNHTAMLGLVKLIAPAWCLDLAYPPGESDNNPIP